MKRAPKVDWPQTRELIRLDLEGYERWLPGSASNRHWLWRLGRALTGTEMFGANLLFRLQVYLDGLGWEGAAAGLKALSRVFYAVSIGRDVRADGGLYLAHGHVVVDGTCCLGERVSLGPFVTLGLSNSSSRAFDSQGPVVGSDTVIGTGAKLFGPIRVGARVRVGANSVVVNDVPDDHTAAGAPAQVWLTGQEPSGRSASAEGRRGPPG